MPCKPEKAKRLRAYMLHYLSMMMAISDIFLLLDGSAEATAKKKKLRAFAKQHPDAAQHGAQLFGYIMLSACPSRRGLRR